MDANKKIRPNLGYGISAIVILIATFGWMLGYDFGGRTTFESIAITFAKIGAFGGMAMFAWSLILSGRYTFLDRIFRGLDKVYMAHRFFGTLGLVLVVIHPLALTLARMPERGLNSLIIWTRFQSTALMLGYISLYGMLALVIWSISAKVKHETFIRVHKLLGVLFFFGVVHAFLAGQVLEGKGFLYWYMLGLNGAAFLTFLHYSIFADMLHPHYRYTVTSVKKLEGGLVDIRLQPKRRILNFKPGQFAYIAFDQKGLHEYHPLSIASSNRSAEMQLIVKQVGDFTEQLASLEPGTKAKLRGPFGGFTFDHKKYNKQLWVAGGIGITPFLSKARSMQYSNHNPQTVFVYATRSRTDAEFALKELEALTAQQGEFHFAHVPEDEFGIVSLERLSEHFQQLKEYAIYVCGPPPMLKAYQQQAEKLGLADQLHYEEFSY